MSGPDVFKHMRFKYAWRQYQARLLAELETHLADDKLHIVAAPGAGKTVLGLEVIGRVARKTLILAPSLLVRDQWIRRLTDDFLDGKRPSWVSTDIHSDAIIRVSTYQYLHTHRSTDIPKVELLCLDEAHHLRRAWWSTLKNLTQQHQPATLSLTATPPYDVEPHEWRNYMELCGPVDAEIPVPELVKHGDLCPHQDLVYLAQTADAKAYQQNHQSEKALFKALSRNKDLVERIKDDPWVKAPREHSDAILENPARFSAFLIYLRHNRIATPRYAKRLLQVSDASWPAMDWEWLGLVLNEFPLQKLPISVLELLEKSSALRHDRLTLPPPKFSDRLAILKNDAAKLSAVQEIFQAETATRGAELRMAVLVDRIGRTSLSTQEKAEFNAISLFRHMLPHGNPHKMAVLTGKVTILPAHLAGGLSGQKLSGVSTHLAITGSALETALKCANRAFENGEIELLIGTHSLLGQGWDAPALNALVLGTRLKSFVAVNQLRGRALRVFKQRPNKAANIWHIAITPTQDTDGEDIDLLHRRFSCFARLDRKAGDIHSDLHLEPTRDAQNQTAFRNAKKLDALLSEWRHATQTQSDFEQRLLTQTQLEDPIRLGVIPAPALSLVARLRRSFGAQPSQAQTHTSLKRVAKLVVASLDELGALSKTKIVPSPMVMNKGADWQIWLDQACRIDEARFHEDLSEFLGAVDNPRYIIHVKSGLFWPRYQYFVVPSRYGVKRDLAQIFWNNWQRYIGRGELIYTRTVGGRGKLQAARLSSCHWSATSRMIWK